MFVFTFFDMLGKYWGENIKRNISMLWLCLRFVCVAYFCVNYHYNFHYDFIFIAITMLFGLTNGLGTTKLCIKVINDWKSDEK